MAIPKELQHEGENVLSAVHPSRLNFAGFYAAALLFIAIAGIIFYLRFTLLSMPAFASLFAIAFFGAGAASVLAGELSRVWKTLYITDRRVLYESKLVHRKVSTALHEKIQDLHVTQKLWERIFGLGDLHINTAGASVAEIVFEGVSNPVAVKKLIEGVMIRQKPEAAKAL